MGGTMMLMGERRAAVLWELDIILLQILIRGRSALRGIMEALQQTRLQLAMVPALRGIIVLPEALHLHKLPAAPITIVRQHLEALLPVRLIQEQEG